MFKHSTLEKNSIFLTIGIIIMISVGGLVEIIPLFDKETTIEKVEGVRPRTPLEQIGFNIYIREGCYGCHSQQVRVLRDEVERYGHYSLAAESMYDHPFQWGSKRTGPDLARVGGKYSDEWHRAHMINPRDLVPESIMPGYPFMADREIKVADIGDYLKASNMVGVPYSEAQIQNAAADAKTQAMPDSNDVEGFESRYKNMIVRDFDGNPEKVTELDALIAYLQTLGTMVDFSTYKEVE